MAVRRRGTQRGLADKLVRSLPGATLTHPFGDDVDVWKVAAGPEGGGGKMFCLIGAAVTGDPGGRMTLKVDPPIGAALVAEHDAISPGYHTDKRHWITVLLDDSLADDLVRELIEDAYDLVVHALPARKRFEVDPDRFPLPSPRR
jgi:predicted DNA-binding protein (MmcQ/YjbR family)